MKQSIFMLIVGFTRRLHCKIISKSRPWLNRTMSFYKSTTVNTFWLHKQITSKKPDCVTQSNQPPLRCRCWQEYLWNGDSSDMDSNKLSNHTTKLGSADQTKAIRRKVLINSSLLWQSVADVLLQTVSIGDRWQLPIKAVSRLQYSRPVIVATSTAQTVCLLSTNRRWTYCDEICQPTWIKWFATK